jgi:hypothetical protein
VAILIAAFSGAIHHGMRRHHYSRSPSKKHPLQHTSSIISSRKRQHLQLHFTARKALFAAAAGSPINSIRKNMNSLKQESHHSSIVNCHKQEVKEASTTTIVVLLTAAAEDAINVRSKRHNLQHEWSYLQQPEAPFSGAIVPLSAVERGNIDNSNGAIYNKASLFITATGGAIISRR